MSYIRDMPRFQPPSMTKTEERDYEIWCHIDDLQEELNDIETDLILLEYEDDEVERKKERMEVLKAKLDELKLQLSYEYGG